jgi:hypothetical protein
VPVLNRKLAAYARSRQRLSKAESAQRAGRVSDGQQREKRTAACGWRRVQPAVKAESAQRAGRVSDGQQREKRTAACAWRRVQPAVKAESAQRAGRVSDGQQREKRTAACAECRVQSGERVFGVPFSVFGRNRLATDHGPRTTDHGQLTTDSQRPTTDNVPCATDCTLGLSNRLAGENACVGNCNRPGALCSAFLRVEKNSAVACLTSATRFAKCGGALRRGNFADICHRHFGVSALGRSGGAADRSSDGEARGGRRARVESNAPAK